MGRQVRLVTNWICFAPEVQVEARAEVVMRKSVVVRFLGVWLLVVVSGCTSAPELAKYPRAQIERPYTLPDKVATWTTVIPFGYYQDNTASLFLPPIPVPLFWRSALSDKWTLNWSPLPTGASYQIDQTESRLLGLSFGAGLGYGSGVIGLVISPSATFYYRQNLTPTVALELVPAVDASFRTGGASATWSTELGAGPLFQVTPFFALRARGTLRVSNGVSSTVVASTLTPPLLSRVTFPLSLGALWSIHRQWDLNFGYSFDGIGYANGYSAHDGTVTVVHYW